MILIDLTHTSHTRARTGIQRVALSLLEETSRLAAVEPVTWDPHGAEWRRLEAWERANLAAAGVSARRSASWPAAARWRGRLRRWLRRRPAALPDFGKDVQGLLAPELFGAGTAAAYPALFAAAKAPRVALFHDAVALQYPELSPPKTVARYPAYLLELARFDGVAAVSEDSRQVLADYWAWAGVSKTPPLVAIPNGIRTPPGTAGQPRPPSGEGPRLLCVGTLEGRKNHLALLEACEALWSEGLRFSLTLVGAVQPETGTAALARLRQLASAGRPLRHAGPVDDRTLEEAYAACDLTVYPSLIEGFGLPVLESVARGRPCLCSGRGALGEAAAGGGCLTLGSVDAASLREALGRLVRRPDELAALAAAARARPVRSTADQARDLLAWMAELRTTSSR